MLNRTQRTLSANLNRLNRGTRALVPSMGANTGTQTFQALHDREDAFMRIGSIGIRRFPIPKEKPPVPSTSVVGVPVCWSVVPLQHCAAGRGHASAHAAAAAAGALR
jgi:hypothetical protein